MRKALCLLLALAMLFTLAACGGTTDPGADPGTGTDDPGTTNPGTTDPGTTDPGTSDPDPVVDRYAWEQTWPDGQVITWLVLDQSATVDASRYDNLKAIEMIEEMFHVDIQFDVIFGAEENEADYLKRLVVSPLPDVIAYRNEEYYKGGIVGLYNDGLIIELNDLIETRMPHLQDVLNEYPNVAKELSTNDGKFLYLQRINTMSSPVDRVNLNNNGLIIRQKWLDAVGLDVPTNIEEWYEVLKAFKTMDPNGNGEFDEIPFHTSGSGIQLFNAAYGFLEGIFIDPATGKVDYGERTQQYKAYLEEMHKWYEEGLIYEDLQAGSKDYENLVAADQVGAWKGSANNNGKGFMYTLREMDPNESITAVPCPATPDGHVYFNRSGVSTKRRETVCVSTDAAKDQAKLDAIATVMDYMISEEGSLLLTWGEEGVTYEIDENGNRVLTEYGASVEHLASGQGVQAFDQYGVMSSYFPSVGCFDVDQATRDQWYRDACALWADSDFSLLYPGTISLTPEQTEELAKLTGNNTELDQYIADMKVKFITGEEPLSNFDTYVDNLERMGIQKIVDIWQAALDEYNAR